MKEINCVVIDGNYTNCGDHFAVYAKIELLFCAPETETNIMLYTNFISRKKIGYMFLHTLVLLCPIS